ncbi:hypothetical protein SAMN05428966_102372 [Massilia sp. PDC64]|nr:hypothetical protein [Massilia sp. PDC64]SDC80400.1 hypothetical protein SAMN05428966_102372 [Massilia sp. PDC64]
MTRTDRTNEADKPETIDNADWRIDTLAAVGQAWQNPWTGELVPVGTLLKKVTVAKLNKKQTLTVTIPNASALLLNIARRAYIAAVEVRRQHVYSKTREPELHLQEQLAFAYLESMFEAVICAHTAVEAYVNELLPEGVTYTRLNRNGEAEILSKEQIERRASLIEKVSKFLPEALGKRSPKGIHRAYSDLQALTKLRDRLIHMKSADRKSSGPDVDTVWHRLLTCDSPIDQAMSVIKYFAPVGDAAPRWLGKMPRRQE